VPRAAGSPSRAVGGEHQDDAQDERRRRRGDRAEATARRFDRGLGADMPPAVMRLRRRDLLRRSMTRTPEWEDPACRAEVVLSSARVPLVERQVFDGRDSHTIGRGRVEVYLGKFGHSGTSLDTSSCRPTAVRRVRSTGCIHPDPRRRNRLRHRYLLERFADGSSATSELVVQLRTPDTTK
jgi:hypothetical protein